MKRRRDIHPHFFAYGQNSTASIHRPGLPTYSPHRPSDPDQIAVKLGIEKTALIRVRAGIFFVLAEAMGHECERLMEQPPERILAAIAPAVRGAVGRSRWPLLDRYDFGPVVDGADLPQHPCEPEAPGISDGIPLLVGGTREGKRFLPRRRSTTPRQRTRPPAQRGRANWRREWPTPGSHLPDTAASTIRRSGVACLHASRTRDDGIRRRVPHNPRSRPRRPCAVDAPRQGLTGLQWDPRGGPVPIPGRVAAHQPAAAPEKRSARFRYAV